MREGYLETGELISYMQHLGVGGSWVTESGRDQRTMKFMMGWRPLVPNRRN